MDCSLQTGAGELVNQSWRCACLFERARTSWRDVTGEMDLASAEIGETLNARV